MKNIGFKIDRHKGKINDVVRKTMTELEKTSDLYILDSLDEINNNNYFMVQLNNETDLFNTQEDYVLLTESEFNTITKAKVKVDKQDLLNVYLNIKKFINMGKDSNKLCYPSHKTLCGDCNISSTGTINKIIDSLVDIGVLFTYNSGMYYDNKGKPKFANSFYALEDGILKQEICDEIIKNYYSTQGIFIDKFIK